MSCQCCGTLIDSSRIRIHGISISRPATWPGVGGHFSGLTSGHLVFVMSLSPQTCTSLVDSLTLFLETGRLLDQSGIRLPLFEVHDPTCYCHIRDHAIMGISFYVHTGIRFHIPSMESRKSGDDDETTREASLSLPIPLFFHRTISFTSTHMNQGPLRTVAVRGRNIYAGSDTGTIQAWRLLPRHELSEYGEMRCKGHQVKAVAVSGDHVFAACADGKIRVWCRSLETLPEHARIGTIPKFGDFIRSYIGGKDLQMTNHLGGITSLAIHDSDDLLYSASLDSTVRIWRISDLRCIETVRAHAGPVNAIVIGEDGILYTGSNDATVKVWRRGGDQRLSLIVSLPTRSSPAKALALASDDMVLYVGCTDGCVYSYTKGWLSGHIQYSDALLGHNHAIMCLACVSNYVASGSADWTCRVWAREAVDHHTCLAVLHGHQGPITGVALFSVGGVDDDDKDGCTVCTGSIDGVLKTWRVTSLSNTGQGPSEGS